MHNYIIINSFLKFSKHIFIYVVIKYLKKAKKLLNIN